MTKRMFPIDTAMRQGAIDYARRVGKPHISTMSYCSGFIVGSVDNEIGLPMNSLKPAR